VHRFSVVDVFTAEPFAGNPAAVVLLHDEAHERWMQQVAAEFGLSETAYAVPRPDGTWDLRWFTPAVEVDFCGHATVATAHVLWERSLLAPDQDAVFHTRAGRLGVGRDGDDLVLDGPARPAVEIAVPDGLEAIVGPEPLFVGSTAPDDPLVGSLFVVLADQGAVVELDPDPDAIAALPCGGLIVTAEADGHAYDSVSRYFTPRFGIDEDPVTGSAHCTIGHYWTERLGRNGIRARQASARGGELNVTIEGDRAKVAGRAVTVATGDLLH
jgi:predicted PhzF superfamily epimerase YddE/YHI9